jgi:short subunit dehydrogenase-like uncharacterized protein
MSPSDGRATGRERAPRRFDVVLWGATGFTGALVAEYLATHYGGQKLRWALGGRSREKLEGVRAGLAAIDPFARELPILLGDSADRASLDAIAREARVVVSTVGPYSRYGSDLVAACVEAGTDYCDLTGETQFVRRMIDAHHARAGATGARIVHCCGFDSIPSDLGTLMVQTAMRERRGRPAAEVRCLQWSNGFAVSGGTVASMLQSAKEATTDPRVRRVLADPYSLDPDRGERTRGQRDQFGVKWDPDFARWSGPFALATTNSRVVMRSNALLGYAYGRGFRYNEAMSAGTGPKGWLEAAAMAAGTAGFFVAAALPPTRWLLAKTVLPEPGEGPSKAERERGRFTARFVATADAEGDGPRPRLFGAVHGMQDPGYGETAKMLSEAALCLALDEAPRTAGGILTPAACMGMRLVERLRSAGMKFETTESAG